MKAWIRYKICQETRFLQTRVNFWNYTVFLEFSCGTADFGAYLFDLILRCFAWSLAHWNQFWISFWLIYCVEFLVQYSIFYRSKTTCNCAFSCLTLNRNCLHFTYLFWAVFGLFESWFFALYICLVILEKIVWNLCEEGALVPFIF